MRHIARFSLHQRHDYKWEACPWGKMAPVIERVPGNTRPARTYEFRTPEEAIAKLRELCPGCQVEIMRVHRRAES